MWLYILTDDRVRKIEEFDPSITIYPMLAGNISQKISNQDLKLYKEEMMQRRLK